MAKRALVISGGGSKGAFAVGVLKQLARRPDGVKFDIVTGTSTGALIAPLVVTGEIDELERIYTTATTDMVITRLDRVVEIFKKGYIHHTNELVKLVKQTLTPQRVDTVLKSNTMAFYTTVCLETGKVTYFQTGKEKGLKPQASELVHVKDKIGLVRAMVASANQPVLTPVILIPPDKRPKRHYIDGGVREYAPVQIAIENGATDITAIVLNPRPEKRQVRAKPYSGLDDILLRTISLLVEEVGESGLELADIHSRGASYVAKIRENARTKLGLSDQQVRALFPASNPFVGKKAIELKVIRPRVELERKFDTSGLEFDPAKMKGMLEYGVEIARAEFG